MEGLGVGEVLTAFSANLRASELCNSLFVETHKTRNVAAALAILSKPLVLSGLQFTRAHWETGDRVVICIGQSEIQNRELR